MPPDGGNHSRARQTAVAVPNPGRRSPGATGRAGAPGWRGQGEAQIGLAGRGSETEPRVRLVSRLPSNERKSGWAGAIGSGIRGPFSQRSSLLECVRPYNVASSFSTAAWAEAVIFAGRFWAAGRSKAPSQCSSRRCGSASARATRWVSGSAMAAS